MRGLLAPGCVCEEITKPPRRVESADQVVALFQAWARAAPEFRGTVTGSVAGAGRVALEVTWQGALKGPFGDFSPTGKPPVALGAFFFSFDERGLVDEIHHYFDSLALFQILGIRA